MVSNPLPFGLFDAYRFPPGLHGMKTFIAITFHIDCGALHNQTKGRLNESTHATSDEAQGRGNGGKV